MDLAFLTSLYESDAPIASVYLDTRRNHPKAHHAIDVRWRDLRTSLESWGAGGPTLDAITAEVGSDRGIPQPQGQAIFAAGGKVLLTEELLRPPVADTAVFANLPRALPLLAQRDGGPVTVLAFASRTGADFEVYQPGDGWLDGGSFEGERDYVHKVRTGDLNEGRYKRTAEETWDNNAKGAAKHLGGLAARHDAGLIVVGGDTRARELLVKRLATAWRERAVVLPGGSRAGGADRTPERKAALALAAEQRNEADAAEVDRFERGLPGGGAVQGIADTVGAVRRGDVDTLLVEFGHRVLDAPLYWAPEPGEVSTRVDELAAWRPSEIRNDPTGEVLVRAVARQGGKVLVTSGGEPGPGAGVGAVLRRG